jgi:hypothetical protein
VQAAVRTHDLPLFEKHVDVEGVTESFVDASIEEALSGGREPEGDWEKAGLAIGKGLAGLMRPKLAEEARHSIREYVRTGVRPRRSGHEGPSLASAVAIDAIDKVDENGELAVADVRTRGPDGRPVVVRLEMREMGGYWQVTKIVNAREVVRALNAGRRAG